MRASALDYTAIGFGKADEPVLAPTSMLAYRLSFREPAIRLGGNWPDRVCCFDVAAHGPINRRLPQNRGEGVGSFPQTHKDGATREDFQEWRARHLRRM